MFVFIHYMSFVCKKIYNICNEDFNLKGHVGQFQKYNNENDITINLLLLFNILYIF